MKPILLDTGVVVALLDRSERYHEQCCQFVKDSRSPLLTCEAVIAESCYLLRSVVGAPEAVLSNVERGIFQIGLDLSESSLRISQLLKKYRDIPMDLADACLVCIAEDFEVGEILTLDSDFNFYRWNGKNSFHSLIELE